MSAPVAASVLLAAAMLYEHRESLLVQSYEVRPEQWEEDGTECGAAMELPEATLRPRGHSESHR
jgi:hypothetical protein